jgi:hypothetical protein
MYEGRQQRRGRRAPVWRDNTRDNIHPFHPLHCVQKTPRFARSGAVHRIHTRRTWLRALWTDWSVEVRVFSGALAKALSMASRRRASSPRRACSLVRNRFESVIRLS